MIKHIPTLTSKMAAATGVVIYDTENNMVIRNVVEYNIDTKEAIIAEKDVNGQLIPHDTIPDMFKTFKTVLEKSRILFIASEDLVTSV